MAVDTELEALAAELVTLGHALPRQEPVPHLVHAVTARLADAGPPATSTPLDRLRARAADTFVRRRRQAVVVVTAVLLALLAAPPVRAAVADWFGFAGIIVRHDPNPSGSRASPPPSVAATTTLGEAKTLVTFQPVVPAALGPPQGVEVSADRRVLSMSWTGGDDGAVRVDQFDARLDYTFAKTSRTVRFTEVAGTSALWFEEPHEVVLLNRDGTRRTETARLAGHTLIWEHGTTTVRLEADVSLARALEIAGSVAPVP
jgi:hypothetical protein